MTFELSSTVSLPWSNRVVFRTGNQNGVLMFIELSGNINIRIEVCLREAAGRRQETSARVVFLLLHSFVGRAGP